MNGVGNVQGQLTRSPAVDDPEGLDPATLNAWAWWVMNLIQELDDDWIDDSRLPAKIYSFWRKEVHTHLRLARMCYCGPTCFYKRAYLEEQRIGDLFGRGFRDFLAAMRWYLKRMGFSQLNESEKYRWVSSLHSASLACQAVDAVSRLLAFGPCELDSFPTEGEAQDRGNSASPGTESVGPDIVQEGGRCLCCGKWREAIGDFIHEECCDPGGFTLHCKNCGNHHPLAEDQFKTLALGQEGEPADIPVQPGMLLVLSRCGQCIQEGDAVERMIARVRVPLGEGSRL